MTTKALVCDDDPAVLERVAATLEDMGMQVTRVENGAQLIQHVADEGPFDLVVTDVLHPWMTGSQIARSVRNAGLRMPILFVSGLDEARLRRELASLAGRSVVLRKPFTTEDLVSAVETLMPGAAAAPRSP
jgi:CheY-like chemotaxis protein